MQHSTSTGYYLVHANIAHAKGPLDAPVMAGFVSQADEVNSLAERTPGFVAAQPKLPDEGTVYKDPFLLNVSLWESVESLDAFTHQGKHAEALERRAEWFVQDPTKPAYVLYWIPKGQLPTERDIKGRLDHLARHGPTPYAFTFAQRFTASEAAAFQPAVP
jgi:hypothetical protein